MPTSASFISALLLSFTVLIYSPCLSADWLQAEEAAAEPSSSTSSQDPYESAEGPEDASFSTMNYWAHRLTP